MHYNVHNSALLIPILNQIKPVYILHPISLTHFNIILPSMCKSFCGPFLQASLLNSGCISLQSCMCHPGYLNLLDLITQYFVVWKLQKSSLCNLLQPCVTSSHLGPNSFLSILCSNALSVCSCLTTYSLISLRTEYVALTSVPLGCGVGSVGNWCTMFWDSMVVSFSRNKMSETMDIHHIVTWHHTPQERRPHLQDCNSLRAHNIYLYLYINSICLSFHKPLCMNKSLTMLQIQVSQELLRLEGRGCDCRAEESFLEYWWIIESNRKKTDGAKHQVSVHWKLCRLISFSILTRKW